MSPRVLVAAFCLLLAACAGEADPAITETPNWRAGYSDGCATAHSHIAGYKKTVRRDESRFLGDARYNAGWRAGFGACGGG